MNTWVAVDTRLPQDDEHVLVYFEYGGLSAYAVAYFDASGGEPRCFIIDGDDCDETDALPSHWRKLPLPPRTEERAE